MSAEQPQQPVDAPPTDAAKPADAFTWQQAGEIFRRLGPAGPLAVAAATLPAIGGFVLLGFMPTISDWLRSHADTTGLLIYIAGFALLAGLALLPTYAQAVLGGFAFQFVPGLLAALGGFGGAALIGYVIAWRASGQRAIEVIASDVKWKAVHTALVGSGFWKTLLIVFLLRVPPNSPFALTNLVMAATRVNPLPYILGTMFGMAPRTAVAVWFGASLDEWDLSKAKNIWLLVVGVIVLLIVLAIIGQIANKAIAKVTRPDVESAPPAPAPADT